LRLFFPKRDRAQYFGESAGAIWLENRPEKAFASCCGVNLAGDWRWAVPVERLPPAMG
jgi:hypothetical protein